MTLSFLTRIADRYQVGAVDVLAALVEVDGRLNLTGSARPDSEVYLNGDARARLAALSGVPQERLLRALPAWTQYEPRQRYAGPAGLLHHGVEKVSAQGPACPGCMAARTGNTASARVYLAPHQRVCGRHRFWLMSVPGTGGRLVDLRRCPEVIEAQRRHHRLLSRCADGAQAFAMAAAVTASWWAQPWPRGDAWSRRLEATRADDEDGPRWQVLARDLVTYPDTVTVATMLADPALRARVAADTRGHLPFSLADTPALVAALSGGLGRAWLADRLPAVTSGPLFTWAHACVRAAGSPSPSSRRALWQIHSAHRLRPLAEEIAALEDPGGG
ncbi:hypothetical protein [Kitasatospora sp. NPDC047058]|uniref:hypothetical protein n=1 Tax=Kitasatospora sp. NPDC047058 TaxID=3155620 RepID=UPI00340362C6